MRPARTRDLLPTLLAVLAVLLAGCAGAAAPNLPPFRPPAAARSR